MTDADAGSGAASEAPPPSAEELRKEVIRQTRRAERLELTLRQLEDIRDTNSRLLDRLRVELANEQARSIELLLNVLPRRIVDRLNAGERQIADRHDHVAVVFCDIVGFTAIAGRLPVVELVERLGSLFASFDAAAEHLGVETIKTIGDAYLAVAGLAPVDGEDPSASVRAAADLALAMADAVAASASDWQVRIGVAVGPVVSGVIGSRRFAFDVWGDTVNVASRLESTSQPGRIHVSDAVAEILGDDYMLETRGTIALKGKGEIRTWFLAGRRRPVASGADAAVSG